MAGPELVVKVGANIEGLRTGMAAAAAAVKTLDTTAQTAGSTLRGTGTAADHAAAKLRYLGTEGDGATPKIGGMTESLRAFDGILASLGLHIGPEIKALDEMSTAAARGAPTLGSLATAGLAAGAAFGGWKIGRVIADLFGLDAIIGNATAKLLGWGDVAAQVAGAKTDVLAMASKRAGFAVTDMTMAIQINSQAWKQLGDNATISAETLARWRAELAKVKGDIPSLTADLASQNFSLKELAARYHVSVEALQFFQRETVKAADATKAAGELTQAHNRTILHALQEQIAKNKEARDLEAASLLATTRLWDEYFALRVSHGGTANETAIAQIQRWAADTEAAAVKAGTATTAFYTALAATSAEKMTSVGIDWDLFKTKTIPALQETEANARRTYDAMLRSGLFFREDLEKQRLKIDEAAAAARGYGQDAVAAEEAAAAATRKATDELEKKLAIIEAAKKANREMGGSSELRDLTKKQFTEAGGENRIAMLENSTKDRAAYGPTYEGMLAFMRDQVLLAELKKFAAMPTYADGVTDAPGGWSMVGERGPERMFVPPHANIYPTGSGAGGSSVTNIYITQPLGTPQQIYAVIDKVITDRQKQIGTRF